MKVTTESGTKYLVNDNKLTRISERPPVSDDERARDAIIGRKIRNMSEPFIGDRWVIIIDNLDEYDTSPCTLRTTPITRIDP